MSKSSCQQGDSIHQDESLCRPISPVPLSEPPYSIFDARQRALIVAIVSIAATFSGFASNIYFPALPMIAKDLGVSVDLTNLTVTSYLIFQGIAPSLWGPVSDVQGRRVAYFFTFIVFLAACVGLALARSYAALLVLRCLQSAGSASTIAIGSGVIGDITTRSNRGGIMGIFQAGLLAPVAVGPVIGGVLAGSLGWHSIFWFLTIYGGCYLICLLLLLPETLRSVVGNGSIKSSNFFQKFPLSVYQRTTRTEFQTIHCAIATKNKIDVFGPFYILASKQAISIILYLAIYYTVWQMSITAMSTLFQNYYGLGEIQIGLTFIANGVGSIVGTLVTGKILNIEYSRVNAAHKRRVAELPAVADGEYRNETSMDKEMDFPIEKARLRLIPVFSVLQCLSILLFGWTVHFPRRVHIAVPIVSTFFTGWTAVSAQSIVMTYLVDVFHDRSAAAGASLNLARCLLAAGGTSLIMPMINSIGVGPAFSVCAAVQATATVLIGIQWKYGGRWRIEAHKNME